MRKYGATGLPLLLLAVLLFSGQSTQAISTTQLLALANSDSIAMLRFHDKIYRLSWPAVEAAQGRFSGLLDSQTPIEPVVHSEHHAEPGSVRFYLFLFLAAALTLFAGLMSGLTVGYLSIDTLVLELKMKNGTEEEQKNAKEILLILESNHHLLCTLLIANAGAMEALPLCLNILMPEVMAVLVSVTAVLAFGEVIPQAICTGPSQIKIAAKVAPLTKFLMMFEAVLAYPIGKILDKLLGEHTKNRYQNKDLKALIELHSLQALQEIEENGNQENVGLNEAQTKLIQGTIDLANVTAGEAMKPYNQVAVVSEDQPITDEFIRKLENLGYSRFPVYRGNDPNQVTGILLVKRLLGMSTEGRTLRELNIKLRPSLTVPTVMPLTDLLVEFQKGKSHLALVVGRKQADDAKPDELKYQASMLGEGSTVLGIVTFEDVIERALGSQILDERDADKLRNERAVQDRLAAQRQAKVPGQQFEDTKRLFAESLCEFEGRSILQLVEKRNFGLGLGLGPAARKQAALASPSRREDPPLEVLAGTAPAPAQPDKLAPLLGH